MGIKYIINTMTAWDEPPRARHQVTTALAKKYKVAFVASNKVGLPKISFTYMDNILLIQPFFPVYLKIRYRIPILNEIYQIWLFNKLKKKV
jgi:antibiotic biosynthesis monooxygenase (ABM) superfamily enzyme